MLFWCVLSCVSFTISIIMLFCKDIYRKWIIYLYILYIGGISAFRYMIGTDYYQYCVIWQQWENNWDFELFAGHEPVFDVILQSLKATGFETQSLFFVYTLLTFAILYRAIKYFFKSNIEIFFAWLCYAMCLDGFWFSMNGIRQALAMAIMLYVSRYVVEKKPINFIFGCLLASLCHYSSLLFVFMYFIPIEKVCIKKILIFMIVGAGIALSGIADKMIESIAVMLIGDNEVIGKYLVYLGAESRVLVAPYYNALIILLYAILIKNNCDHKMIFILNMSAVYVFFFFVFNMGEFIRVRQGVVLYCILLNASLISILYKRYKMHLALLIIIAMMCSNFAYRIYEYGNITSITPSGSNIEYMTNFNLY